MKKIYFAIIWLLLMPLFLNAQMGHFPTTQIPTLVTPYTVKPNYLQNASYTTINKSEIGASDIATIFVNYTEDTTNHNVILVYTTNGTAPTKTNGTQVTMAFYNFTTPHRTWTGSIPAQAKGTTVKYIIYRNTANTGLAAANRRTPSTNSGTETNAWTEGNSFFSYTVRDYPGGVSSALSLWIKADSGLSTSGSNVTGWTDQTAINTFSISGTPQYTSLGLNFNPCVNFNGSSYFIGNTSITNSTDCFAVANIQNSANAQASGAVVGNKAVISYNYFFHTEGGILYHSGGESIYSGTSSYGNSIPWSILNANNSNTPAASDVINLNGINSSNAAGGDPITYSAIPTIGSRNTEAISSGSKIAEVILYNSSKSSNNERIKIQSYLGVKYGITLGNTTTPISYLSSNETTIWTGSSTYQNNIIGIGKDILSGLEQQISTSQSATADIITLSTDTNFTNANGTHSAITNDNYFLITGHNNGATTYTTYSGLKSTNIMARIWKVQETGTDQGLIYIKTSNATAKYLIVSADATFNDAYTWIALTSGATAVNLSNGQFFTFGNCPTAKISGSTTICSNGTTTLSPTSNGTWSSSNTAVATVSNAGIVTGVAGGSVSFTYTATDGSGCSGTTASLTITTAPNAGTLSGTQAICSNGTSTFTSNGNTGGAYTSSATGIATVNSASGVITPVAAGTATITYTVTGAGGCLNATATRDVTINAFTIAGSLSSDQAICTGTSPSDLVLTGNIGSVLKWQKSTNSAFTNPTDITSTSTTLASSVIGNLTATTYFRAVVQNGTCSVENSNYITITISTTTWDGSAWSNGPPVITTTAYMTGNYSEATDLFACTLTVSNNAIVSIPSGFDVTLNGKLTVDAGSSFTLNNNSNLFQQTDVSNTGDIVVKRMTTPIYRLDYTLWSSPVTGSQTLMDFSPLTSNIGPTNIRFYTYNTLTNQYNSVNPVTTTFDAAKGYLIRSPNNWISYNSNLSPAPQKWTGSFTGVPRNGNVTFTMANTGTNTAINATGNPYPSALLINNFINGNTNNIEGTLWFWRKFNDNNNLVSYSTCSTIGCTLNNNATYSDNNLISIGQGFMVKAKAGQTNLNFTNSMRSSENVDQFFKSSTTQMDRYWLKMTNSTNISAGQNLIAYTPTATYGYDSGLDGLYSNDSSVAFYSKADNQDVVINARPSFDVNDVIPMVFKSNVADTYTFSLNQKEGIFNGTQDVLLRDNYNNIVQNLTLGDYSFSTAVGTFTDRFDIIYQNLLSNTNTSLNANQILIYNKDQTTYINSGEITMDSIKIFDIQGRLLFQKSKINDTKTSIKLDIANQVLLFQITTQNGEIITKKVIN